MPDSQLDSSFEFFGKFLYEHIKSGALSYSFVSRQKALTRRAQALINSVAGEETPGTALKKDAPAKTGRERRGQFEPYVNLIVELRVSGKRLLEMQNDLKECLAPGILRAGNDEAALMQKELEAKMREMTSLLSSSEKEIKSLMELKRKLLEENNLDPAWEKDEESFLKKAAGGVAMIGSSMNALIDEARRLLEESKESCENDLASGRRAGVKEEGGPEAKKPVQAEDEKLILAGLSGKLKQADSQEKKRILNNLLHGATPASVRFIYEFIKGGDALLRKELISFLSKLGHPKVIELCRWLIADTEVSLRLQGIMGLAKLGSDESKQAIAAAANDPESQVRRLIANYLEHSGNEVQATAIARLANDSDATVQRIAIRKLGAMANQFAFVNLVPRLEDPKSKIRKEAIMALAAMVGTDLGYSYAARESARREKAKEWQALAEQSYTNPRLLDLLRKKYMRKEKTGKR